MKPLLNLSSNDLAKLGVTDWGYTDSISPASFERYEKWCDKNQSLTYLVDHRKLARKSLRSIDERACGVLSFLFSYAEIKKSLLAHEFYQVASYGLAYNGEDYHDIIREKLLKIISILGINAKPCVDIYPILERDFAYQAGLGWFGKNSMLIHQKWGSYTLIGSIVLFEKLDLASSKVEVDHCGNCTRCIENCPTDAIDGENRTIVLDKCISTFTIELKEAKVPEGMETSRGEIFGCDICQDVCPWNKKRLLNILPRPLEEKTFELIRFFTQSLGEMREVLMSLSNKGFIKKFKGTVFVRPGKKGLLKNLDAYKEK